MRVHTFRGPASLSLSPARVGMCGPGVGFRIEPYVGELLNVSRAEWKLSRPGAFPIIARVSFGNRPDQSTEVVDIPINSRRSFYFERAFRQVEFLIEYNGQSGGPVQENAWWQAYVFESADDRIYDGPPETLTIAGPDVPTIPSAAPPVTDILWQTGTGGEVHADVIEIYEECKAITYFLKNQGGTDQDINIYAVDSNAGFCLVETITVPASLTLAVTREVMGATGLYLRNMSGGTVIAAYVLQVRA